MGPAKGQLGVLQLWRFLNDQYVRTGTYIFAVFGPGWSCRPPWTALYVLMPAPASVAGAFVGAIK